MAKRNLMTLTVSRNKGADGESTYGSNATLPMGDATDKESETCAAFIMQAVNAQLDYSGSAIRLRAWDIKNKEYVVFQEK